MGRDPGTLAGWGLPKLLLGAVFVAAAAGSVHYAIVSPVGPLATPSPPPPSSTPSRRSAEPRRFGAQEVPLRRVSRVHVAIDAHATHARPSGSRQLERVSVLLDTGSSVALATVDGQELLGLEVGGAPPLPSRGFSGHVSKLFGLDGTQSLELALAPPSDPSRVAFSVAYLSPNRLYDADVIAPPHLVAPRGGAVRLDFAADRFALCESAAQCRGGDARWVAAAARPCSDRPELVVVDVVLGDAKETMLLDTGAATLVFEDAFERARLEPRVERSRKGHLLGAGSATVQARVVAGAFTWGIGVDGALRRTPESFWVVPVPKERPAACATAGSIGTDLLAGCRVIIVDGEMKHAELSCTAVTDAGAQAH